MSEARPPTRQGVFFSFEGIDGSGKSTQALLLAEALEQAGKRVVRVREPGGTVIGEQVRALLLDPVSTITDRAEALLFAAARAQLVEEVVEPALASGTHVIADRYVDSTSAYQGGGRGLGDAVNAVSAFATSNRLPDRTYLVSLPLEDATARRAARDADRMEQLPDRFTQQTAFVYERLASEHAHRILRLDGRLSVDTLHSLIMRDALDVIRQVAEH